MSSFIKKAFDCKEDMGSLSCGGLIKPRLLSCGKGEKAIFVGPDNPSVIIGRVLVDAGNIIRPTVSIEFSSIVSFLATNEDAEGELKFSLFRACSNQSIELLNSWSYEIFRIDDRNDGMRFTDSFSFNYCDSLCEAQCCKYLVEVSIESLSTANIVVNNVHITAVV